MTLQPTWQRGDVQLFLGDCRELLPQLPAGDAIVTSPPYLNQREYQIGEIDWDSIMDSLLMRYENQALVNLGQICQSGEVCMYWEQWRERMRKSGWRFFGMYVWDKGFGLPGDWNGRLAPSHEYVLHFTRTQINKINKTVACKSVGRTVTGTGIRNTKGRTQTKQSGDGNAINEYKIPDSVIRISPKMNRDSNEHPAVFPIPLPKLLIETFTADKNATILDPFMGSGTTGVAAVKLGRKFIGIEICESYFNIAVRRISEAQDQFALFDPIPPARAEATLFPSE